jgi:hypothetical protein
MLSRSDSAHIRHLRAGIDKLFFQSVQINTCDYLGAATALRSSMEIFAADDGMFQAFKAAGVRPSSREEAATMVATDFIKAIYAGGHKWQASLAEVTDKLTAIRTKGLYRLRGFMQEQFPNAHEAAWVVGGLILCYARNALRLTIKELDALEGCGPRDDAPAWLVETVLRSQENVRESLKDLKDFPSAADIRAACSWECARAVLTFCRRAIITHKGASHSSANGDGASEQLSSKRLRPVKAGVTPKDQKPAWDRHQRRLSLDDQVLIQYRKSAPSQWKVLDGFQNNGWPDTIPSPFGLAAKKLKDAVEALNSSLKDSLKLEFVRGIETVSWQRNV